MNVDKSVYEPMLRQTEKDLGVLENERIELLREIARLQREVKRLGTQRIEWVRASGSLKMLLELPLTEEERELCGKPAEKDRLALIPEGAFKGMTLTQAARECLTAFGGPASHRELVDGLRKGGVNPDLKHLDNSVRTALNRQPGVFILVKEEGKAGEWELCEWNGEIAAPTVPVARKSRQLSVVGGSDLAARQA